MNNFPFELFATFKLGHSSFSGKSVTYYDSVKVLYLLFPIRCNGNVPLGIIEVSLDPVDRCVQLNMSVKIEVRSVRLDVAISLRSSKMSWKILYLIRQQYCD